MPPTDSIGETIDFGPCAFMDSYDPAGSVPCSAASDSSGLPGLNPLRWNCMVSPASPDAIVCLLDGCELAFVAKPHFGVSRRDQGATCNPLSPQDDGGNLSVCGGAC
jgi:hypothetical protein